MRTFKILFILPFLLLLSACNMVGWESGFEELEDQNENPIADPIDIEDTDDSSQGNQDDPYRKYDDGVIEYDYDEMTWVNNGLRTYYIKIDTEVLHGMYFSTFDGVVENGISAITYYYDGEKVRYVEYIDYPLIELEERYFDTWTDEFYSYYDGTEQVMAYYKREYIDEIFVLVELIRYNENGTVEYTQNYSQQGRIFKYYDENGMLTGERIIEYPDVSAYSYFDDGSVSYKLVGKINTDNYTYDEFIDNPDDLPYRLFSSAVYEKYRSPGILEESAVYGVLTLVRREYDVEGILTFEKESFFEVYNTLMYSYERIYSEGLLYSETCWDAYTYFYCSKE